MRGKGFKIIGSTFGGLRVNPRFRSKHKRTHRNMFGLWPQQQAKIERELSNRLKGI